MPDPDIQLVIAPILEEISEKGKSVGVTDDKENIKQFLAKEINGDSLTHFLVISATLTGNRSGLLVYLLTTAKLAKIEIDKEKVQSFSTYLKEVIGVNRTLLNDPAGNNAKIIIEFLQGSFGLLYEADNATIDVFFQKVEEAVRGMKAAPDGKK